MTGSNRKLVILQNRDAHLFRELAVMRVIDREQAKVVAGFHSTTRANARLLALTKAGFLRRFFWGSVGGARKALYALSLRGAQIAGVPYRRPRRGQNQILAADSLAAHQLGMNEIYCALKYPLVLDHCAVKFLRWIGFQEPLTGTGLVPDGYAEMETPARVLALFFEMDLGSESRNVWEKKVQAYLSYAASGNFAVQFGQPQFRTLVVTNSEARLRALRAATAPLTYKVFRFTALERIKREGFWASIWQRPTGDDRQTLI
jgi:hypothetical protein